jgi:VWFA-related protein
MFITHKTRVPLILPTLLWLVPSTMLLLLASRESTTLALYVTVEDGDKLIDGLSSENFRVIEEDKPRPFRLEPPESPTSIALLVEHSRASWYYYNDIVSAMQGFLNAAPEGNWYALATFAHQLEVEVDFTKDKGKLAAAYAGLGYPMWNEVDTYDAIHEMLEKMERLPGRRVLIVIGSGFDSFSSRTLDDVNMKIESVNVLVYGIGAGSMLRGYYEPYLGSSARLDLLQAEAFLKMLADKSGGQAWFPRFETAFPDVLKGVMQMLEHQYKLVYESQLPPDGRFHKIKVEAFRVENDKRHDYKVRVREGWRF